MTIYGIYPNSTPEFRIFQKENKKFEMQVRYINTQMKYTGKWMPVKTEQENGSASIFKT
jgi:hypothetical protein